VLTVFVGLAGLAIVLALGSALAREEQPTGDEEALPR
jgi:hypothetical protein